MRLKSLKLEAFQKKYFHTSAHSSQGVQKNMIRAWNFTLKSDFHLPMIVFQK